MKQLLIVIYFFFFTGLLPLFGQTKGMNAISTAGSSIESKNLVISWTIGEDLIDFSIIDAAMTAKPGNKSDVMEMKDGTLLKVYPTLTTGLITVEIRSTEFTELRLELLDIKGSKLKVINLDSNKMQLDLGSYVQGGYYIKISNKNFTDQKIIRITKI
jgi:hypothetical protein